MAFGWKFGGEYGKLALSLFRIVAIGFLMYYVGQLIKRSVTNGLIASFSLILAGAIGNIIDSAFYGLIFSESDYHCAGGPAKLFPATGGYESFLHGRVVDMLFFPLWRDDIGNAVFFQPVFNIADSAITIGVISILLFQRQYFNSQDEKKDVAKTVNQPSENTDNLDSATQNADYSNDLTTDNVSTSTLTVNTEGDDTSIDNTFVDDIKTDKKIKDS